MTPERAKELLPIIEAYASGAKIQSRRDDEEWRDDSYPLFNSMSYEFRIKPEPREFWVCWDGVKNVGLLTERPDACVYPCDTFGMDSVSHWKNIIKVREVIE